MYDYSNIQLVNSNGESVSTETILYRVSAKIGRIGTQLVLLAWLLTGQAAAQHPSPHCVDASSATLVDLLTLIGNLHNLALTVALPLAGLIYSYCGLLWLSGSPELQRRARKIFVNATIGLIIIILSESIVEIIAGPLC